MQLQDSPCHLPHPGRRAHSNTIFMSNCNHNNYHNTSKAHSQAIKVLTSRHTRPPLPMLSNPYPHHPTQTICTTSSKTLPGTSML
ncbi:hypothetical protein BC829DRAFT_390503, partial [Chytridium lagenaria]